MYESSLVIGKFYPPTMGHLRLIKEASKRSKHVTVIVMGSLVESISVKDRVKWIDESTAKKVVVIPLSCEAPVDYDSDLAWTMQVFAMKSVCDGYNIPFAYDAVFSSEAYGERLAKYFKAEHVLVDIDRKKVPISATEVRSDLGKHWNDLIPAARQGMALRAVFLGAESTGTTTTSLDVAAHYEGARWVEEYGRRFTVEELQRLGTDDMSQIKWNPQVFCKIASEQRRLEEEAAMEGGRLLVCDTDALATGVWEERYIGHGYNFRNTQSNRVYFLTDHEGVPFERDGLRDSPPRKRRAMTMKFARKLNEYGESWVLLTGTREERLLTATTVIDRLLAKQATFADPI